MAHSVVVASNNAHKLQELREIFDLAGPGDSTRLIAPNELDITLDPEETADTYLGNALLKGCAFAQAIGRKSDAYPGGLWIIADDSGLEVDALDGRPGIYSARYHKAAPNGDGCAALLSEMDGVPVDKRTARFRCVIILIAPDGREHVFDGTCEGRIGYEKRGASGFGFDPVFLVENGERTMAELSAVEKHRISHRGVAARKAAECLCAL